MIGDYTVLDKSMNGVKTLSDGISLISDGTATHDYLYYNDIIQSTDGQTTITNDSVTTETITCDAFNATNIFATDVSSNIVECKRLYVRDASNNSILDVNGTAKTLDLYGTSYFRNPVNLINYDFNQTQSSRIYQQGTNSNSLKDTYINGFLSVGSNITQTGGSTALKDTTCDNLTLRENKSITQTGTSVSNTLAGTTTTKDLIILNSVVFPSSVTVPGTTTTDDIVMEGDSVIVQDLTTTTTKKNIFRNTKTLDLEVDGNISQIKGGATATLKNTVIQGTAEIQGDITQTTGATILKTINCNNITLNADQNITQSGSGYITQSGTGQNTLKEINLTNNSNVIFNGNGVISQPLNTAVNVLNNSRFAGYSIFGGRNNTTFSNTQNIQNNNGLQLQFNRDNTTQYSYLMNNRGSGGNGGFRFQRYIGGVYLDEPIVVDDTITFNKNLNIPAGSITCSSATIGAISQSELNCLDNCAVNIQTQFNTIDSQISSLQGSSSTNSTALTGISYNAGTDTTLIDNNLTVNKNLVVGATNIISAINSINFKLTDYTYDFTQDLVILNNHLILPSGNNFFLGNGYNVKNNLDDCINKLTGITYTSGTDTTNIDNNVQISAGKKLMIGTMDVGAEITALETSFTTGTINSTDLTTTNLTVNNNARFGQVGGSAFIKNDVRFCNVMSKSENEYTQFYQSGIDMTIAGQQNNSALSFSGRNSSGTLTQYFRVNPTSFNVKNTNMVIDNNLTVSGTTNLQSTVVNTNLTVGGDTTIGNDLTVNDAFLVNDACQTFSNFVASTVFTEQTSFTPNGSTPTVDLAQIIITEPFTKAINLNLSFTGALLWRNGYISPSNQIQYTSKINYFTIFIYKNGVLWQANAPQSNVQGLLYENTFRLLYSQNNETFKYFLNNSLIQFTPDIKTTTDTPDIYSIRVSFNFITSLKNFNGIIDQEETFTGSFTTFQPAIYANVSFSYNGTDSSLITSTANPVDIVSYTHGTYAATSYSVNYNIYRFGMDANSKREFQCVNSYTNTARIKNLFSENSTISNANISILSGSVSGNLRCKSFVAGYVVDGNVPYTLSPIYCSINGINPNNADDGFIIMPGYKFELYDSLYYLGTKLQTIENTSTNDSPQYFASTSINRASSIKVFYRPTNTSSYSIVALNVISNDFNGDTPTS